MLGKRTVPVASVIKVLLERRCIPVLRLPVFDTTSPGVGDRLKPRICASRESHPSEDLSELPPLLVSVAGQEYHYILTNYHCETARIAVFWPDGLPLAA